MAGRLAYNHAFTCVFMPERIGAVTVYYNGMSITSTAIMFDTADADEMHVLLNIGTKTGTTAVATLFNSIYQSQTNNPTTASLLSGASFTSRGTSSAGDELVEAYVDAKSCERYVCLVTEVQNAAATTEAVTIDFGAVIALTASSRAVTKTLEFDV